MTEGGQKRILLVDDDQNISRFLGEALRLHGRMSWICRWGWRATGV